ncbi:ATP-binding protein [Pseudomonas borbori]
MEITDDDQTLLRQQKVLAEFGKFALRSDDLDKIFAESCKLVREALDTDLAKVIQIGNDGNSLLVRAGVHWKPGIVGELRLTASPGSPEAYSLATRAPVVSANVATETRFRYHDFLLDHGVEAFVNVLILGAEDEPPFGILEVDSRVPRAFTDNDIDFLQSYANLIAAAVERQRTMARIVSVESNLRQSERHYRISARLNPQLLWGADARGEITYVDDRWLEATGLGRADIFGSNWRALIHTEDRTRVYGEWADCIISHKPLDVRVRLCTKTGSYGWFRVRAFPDVDVRGECVQWYGTVEDIRERMQLEAALREANESLEQRVADRTEKLESEQRQRAEAEEKLRQSQKMEAVGQLTGGIAHDFNNLLASIMTSLELMQLRIDSGKFNDLARYNNLAVRTVKRAAALTHRLLAFSRQQALEPKQLQSSQVVVELEELIRRTVGPNITVTSKLGARQNILCDPNQLENALINLAINARDAMPLGGALIMETRDVVLDEQQAMEYQLAPGGYVSIAVTDNGSGMSPEVVARAFDPFFTTKQTGEGTGLGLSMIYGFTQQSGGQVRIHSQLGVGTTVTMYFPQLPESQEHDALDINAMLDLPMARGEVVLLVDDEVVVRQLVFELLRELGYRAVAAIDSTSAFKQSKKMPHIDLIVTDIGLPGAINGMRLAEAIRDIHPNAKVLFITGFAKDPGLDQAIKLPGTALLTKPFGIEEFSVRVRSLLDGE